MNMIENQYRITLYYPTYFSELFNFDFPVLPNVGDTILVEERTLFFIQSRSFNSGHSIWGF